ncbi:MAG: hypothetical protein V4757_08215 [Pseudomonadota bacterium]
MNPVQTPVVAFFRRATLLATLSLAALFGGCGGDGDAPAAGAGSTTISGTAAAGAPIIGTVTIKDSSSPAKTKSATITADGKYTVDVSGMTAPFMMRADGTVGGRSYSLYSAATAADVGGTINVTPLTDLIVANIAGQIAGAYFASGNFSGLTAAALATETAALKARLQPILAALGVASSIDLLRASFNTDHTGLDAALDVLRVEVDPATALATITNIIDNVQIVDDLASKSDTSVLPATNVASSFTDFQLITAAFDGFSKLFATSLPASNNAALLALFTTDFLDDGQDRDAFLSEVTSSPHNIGIRFDTITLQGALAPAGTPTDGTVSFLITQQGNSFTKIFRVKKVGSAWMMAGNQHIAMANALTFARLQNGSLIDTGLTFEIKDDGARGIDYAIVKGPGLPVEGVLYVNFTSNNSFGAATGTYAGESTQKLHMNGHNQIPLGDGAIGSIPDNATYTVELWDDGTTTGNMGDDVLMATYTAKLGKRPHLSSELTTASFAVITAPSAANLTAFALAGGSQLVTWTLPAGASAVELHYFRSSVSFNGDNTSIDLAAAATSGTLTMTVWSAGSYGALQANGINLYIHDAFGRELVTIFNGTSSSP